MFAACSYQLQNPNVTASNSSYFISGENVNFNMEETANSAKVAKGSFCDSWNVEKGKRTVIDLDEYDEIDQEANRGNNELAQVKTFVIF